jgi:tetratricopeptide (TPR) repeat protein
MKNSNIKKILPYRRNSGFFFKAGIKYAEKKLFHKAVKFLGRAVEMEPFNLDYKFNFAGVLAELREYEKSNDILLDIIKNIDPTLTECYFGLGCNYFDTGDLKRAKEYFEKYIYFDPQGQFVEEVQDILSYLQVHSNVGMDRKLTKGSIRKHVKNWKRLLKLIQRLYLLGMIFLLRIFILVMLTGLRALH